MLATLDPVTPSHDDAEQAPLSTTALESSRDGLTRLERHWSALGQPKAAMVLVHGIGEHSGRYEHVGARLAAAGIDVLGYDNRGFGQSGGKRGHVDSFDDYLDDIEDVLAKQRDLGVPVVLLGHSLGGLMVSTYLVSRRPQPDLAVLSAPALAAEVPTWQRAAAPLLSKVAPKAFVKSKIEPELLSRDRAVQQAYLDDPLVFGGATAQLGAEIFKTMSATTAALSSIAIPTYVIHGGDDELVPTASSEPLATLANVERRVWDGLRHECFNEPEHDGVIDELLAWIEQSL